MGAKYKQQMKVDMILKFLPNSFGPFRINYNIIRKDLTLTQLMHELESVEESVRKSNNVYQAENYTKLKWKLKGGNINKKKKGVLVTNMIAIKKSKYKCFKCNKKGF